MSETGQQFAQNFARLTPRQQEILPLIVEGKSNQEIAEQVHIAEGTVRKYVQHICDTLQVEGKGGRSRKAALIRLVTTHRPNFLEESEPDLAIPEVVVESEPKPEAEFDPEFVGRDDAIADLDRLVQRGKRCILIQNAGGTGKTTLAEQYLHRRFQTPFLRFNIAKESQNVGSIEGQVREWVKKLGEEPVQDFVITLERLRSQLQAKSWGILIDNLEPALNGNGKLGNEHHYYLELLRVLCDKTLKSITLITSRERIWENLNIELYKLEGLSLEAWIKYFELNEIFPNSKALGTIHKVYQGNALAMEVIKKRVMFDYGYDIDRYWKFCQKSEAFLIEMAVGNLISEQFERLQSSQGNNKIAYKLLCRMGCFRYQDVSTVPIEGLLALLWDIPKEVDKLAAIQILRDRALISYEINGEYKLHPIIRSEAIKRLRNSEEWRMSNCKVAEFWESVKTIESIDDAYRAIEAYHHYVIVDEFERAASVLIKKRDNNWEHEESLGRALYRLGLLKEAVFYIEKILDFVFSKHFLCDLHNILGDIYWLSGNPRKALSNHWVSGKLAKETNQRLLLHRSFFNSGLCYLELGEYEKSLSSFKESLEFTYMGNHKVNIFTTNAYICLSKILAKSDDEPNENLQIALTHLSSDPLLKCIVWCYGYSLISIGFSYQLLGEYEQALARYEQVIEYANRTNYRQLKAKAWIYISVISRLHGSLNKSLSYASDAVQEMWDIGAKCDLAEAHYQRALTYQAMGDPRSQADFAKALELWGPNHIDAPKQIARVKASMQTPL